MLSPDWNSLDAVSKFESLLGIGEWVCLAVAAASEVAALFLGKMQRLQRALEIAGAVAFLAFIPILHFEHVYSDRSAQLLMANTQSEKQRVSQLRDKLTASNAQVAVATQKAAQASAELKEIQQKLKVSENQILDLERKGQARTLTKQQRDHIISELLPYNGHAGVMIYEESSETEVQAFASQLASVLRDSGWSVNVAQAELVKGQPFYGLKVDVGDFYNPPVSATALVKALRDVGIHVDVGLDTDNGPKGLYLMVGSKQ